MEPTLELVLQPPAVGTDPLAALLIALATLWIFGAPWLRLCWWLGARARQTSCVVAVSPAPQDVLTVGPSAPVERTLRFALLLLALGAGLRALRR